MSVVSPAGGGVRTPPTDDALNFIGLVSTAVSGGSASFIMLSVREAGDDGS